MIFEAIAAEDLQGNPELLLDVDLNTCSMEDLFESPMCKLQLKMEASGLVGWFDLQCCNEHKDVILSTSPSAPKTHWLQSWMPFQKPLNSDLHLQIRLLPQSSAGLPELCVVISEISADKRQVLAQFFLDRGLANYEPHKKCQAKNPNESPMKRLRRDRCDDIEAVYFPSDLQELLGLAETAVKEGAG